MKNNVIVMHEIGPKLTKHHQNLDLKIQENRYVSRVFRPPKLKKSLIFSRFSSQMSFRAPARQALQSSTHRPARRRQLSSSILPISRGVQNVSLIGDLRTGKKYPKHFFMSPQVGRHRSRRPPVHLVTMCLPKAFGRRSDPHTNLNAER